MNEESKFPMGDERILDELFQEHKENSGWIPVSERLPKNGGWYLVTWEDQFKTVRRVAVSEFIEPKGLTDIGHFEGFVMNEIIAWMPLPEPYKGVMPNDRKHSNTQQ